MNIKDLELVSFLKDHENYISGDEMLKRAGNALTNYEEMLKQQDKFPKEWREYYIVFPKLLGDYRYRRVAYFNWGDRASEWVLFFCYVDSVFGRRGRFVRPRELPLDSGTLGASGSLVSWPLDELIINGVTYIKK
jgi:hypothetical protein